MTIPDWVSRLFQHIDARDAAGFVAHLTEDGLFRYGSQAPVRGRAAVEAHVHGFLSGLAGVSHRLTGFWWGEPDRICFVAGEVSYDLSDGRQVRLPFLNQFHMDGGLIHVYLIYADPSPLMATA